MKYGFVRAAAAVPEVKVADCRFNAEAVIRLVREADAGQAQFLVFPELCLTAYSCGDLLHQDILIKEAESQLFRILEHTAMTNVLAVLGMPVHSEGKLFNCAVAIQKGIIIGAVPKTYIPGYKEFYEERWFSAGDEHVGETARLCGQEIPFGTDLLFECKQDHRICLGVEICEDLWVPVPPSSYQAVSGAVLLFNLSASTEEVGKNEYRKDLVRQQSARCMAGYVYTSCGAGESTTDVVYGGHSIIAENGTIHAESKRFSDDSQIIYGDIDIDRLLNDRLRNTSFSRHGTGHFRRIPFDLKQADFERLQRHIEPYPFVPSDESRRNERCSEIFNIQTSGLAKRIRHTGLKRILLGVSGGLDSTLALLVSVKVFDMLGYDKNGIIAVTMPGFGTTKHTYANAIDLARALDVSIREIDIKEACLKHFEDIGHDPADRDVTYENVQARERTQILMDLANKLGGLVVGTGDLSEMALGWSTYNGDHMSMYAVNCGVPKTLVRYLVKWVADNEMGTKAREVLNRILDTPVTPELLPPDENGDITQKTEDIIGPYELHDFFLYHMIRYGAGPAKILFLACEAFDGKYSRDEIKKWLAVFIKRFFTQQFKRSCVPDGPKVGTISLSPRGDWRMPSDASYSVWLRQLEQF